MILTKFLVVHNAILDAYFDEEATRVRSFVRDRHNCEDIALNALVANMTGLPPLYVMMHRKVDYGTGNGLYLRAVHADQRHECLNYMCEVFNGCPFKYSTKALAISKFQGDHFVHGSKDADKKIQNYLRHDWGGDSTALRKDLNTFT